MNAAVWIIAGLAIAGIVVRPFRWPEAVWAAAATLLILVLGLLSPGQVMAAIGKGGDVYLFLVGMMVMSEVARREGLFDWVAALAVNASGGSSQRLFLLTYAVGTVITIFLSNDATAVVLTPAIFAAARKARASPLPLLLICALVANAASFVLPISNPANIVLYGDHTPPLVNWLARFALPSALSIVATYAALRWNQRAALRRSCEANVPPAVLSRAGRAALIGLGLTALVLMIVSAVDQPLGLPTAVMGIATMSWVLVRSRQSPLPVLRGVAWSVLPLVAGLFVVVEALNRIGVAAHLAAILGHASSLSDAGTAAVAGGAIALGSNLVNNLPAGLLARAAISVHPLSQRIIDAILIGVDLGPNLSITGSLATILWLGAIRREGEDIGFWTFLKVGLVVMPPALILAIGAQLLLGEFMPA